MEDEISNEIYIKDKFALGKLISEESEQELPETMNKNEGEIRVPDNNPFKKKRKVEACEEKENTISISMEDFEEHSVGVNCTPLSQRVWVQS